MADYMKSLRRHSVAAAAAEAARSMSAEPDRAAVAQEAAAKSRSEGATAATKSPPLLNPFEAAGGAPVCALPVVPPRTPDVDNAPVDLRGSKLPGL